MGCLLPSRTRCLILALVFCGITSALADTSDQQTPAPPPALVSITDSNASQLERQADQRSDEWVERYRADAQRLGLPR